MKLKLLSLAVIAATTLPTSAVLADGHAGGPTFYGVVDASVNMVDEDGSDSYFEARDNSSRIGLKGSEDLGGLTAVYQIEFGGVGVTDGKGINGSNRNSFIGLQGDFGTIFVGRHDTPFKKAQGKVDAFNDGALDMKNFIGGEERMSNAIGWKSNDLNGMSAFVQFQPGEKENDNDGETLDGVADAISLMVKYDVDAMFLAFAYEMNAQWGFWEDVGLPTADATNSRTDAFRLTGMYKMDNAGVGAMFQSGEQADIANPWEQTALTVSGYVMMDQTKFEASFTNSAHERTGSADVDIDVFGLGLEQHLSKQTHLFASYQSKSINDADTGIFQVGARHKF